MAILGEVSQDEDGVLHGWCWCPDAPAERRAVEILMDDTVIATVIASRFREDLRYRKFGDGYHGFSVTLTKHIAEAPRNTILRARDLKSGTCFWQKRFGKFSVPDEFSARAEQLRASLNRAGHAAFLTPNPALQLRRQFGALGQRLVARAGALPPPRAFTLAAPAQPRVSIIMDATSGALHALRRSAAPFTAAGAETILTDAGDPEILTAQSQAQNLKYLALPGTSAAIRRNAAAALARAPLLVFLTPAEPGPAHALKSLPESLTISGTLADAAARIAPRLFTNMRKHQATSWPGFQLAFSRALNPFDPSMDDGAGLDLLDFVLTAARNGAPIAVWRCPWCETLPAKPMNPEAGQRFAEKWIQKQDVLVLQKACPLPV